MFCLFMIQFSRDFAPPICQHYNNQMSFKDYDHLIKLILIGSSGVGKSSILMQFAENKFTENYLTTIGVDFRFKTIKEKGKNIKFQIWDTAGQERFRTITSAYYKGADGIIMIYDLTEPSSLDDIENFWINEAYNYCDKSIKVMLLGNKSDCERKVSAEKAKNLANRYNFVHFQVSAKTADKIHDTIKDFGLSTTKHKENSSNGSTMETPKEPSKNNDRSSKVHLNPNQQTNPNYKKSCC